MSGVTVSEDGIVTGNTYDKYGSTNPFVRRLMDGFESTLDELMRRAEPRSLLDVGCGEGVLVHRWALSLPESRMVGIDLEEESIQAGWSERQAPNLEYRTMPAEDLPFAADEFDLATAIEVLEHVPDPEHTLAEMAKANSGIDVGSGGRTSRKSSPLRATSGSRVRRTTQQAAAR